MNPSDAPTPAKVCHREDALAVLRRLRDAGHVAYFAGGCVRDLLMGREPKDWDVATDAPPPRVRQLFSNTQAVGQAFGVILVRHRRSQIEVATFRTDVSYTDGRRPTEVRFTTPQEDAQRRDFTINGLFLDPMNPGALDEQVIDFVGGRADLAAGVIRAIGEPEARFEEDHLRLLRAVRFAARFGFAIAPSTAAAIQHHATQLTRISPERIGEELRLMLAAPTRDRAWRLLNELDLAVVIFRFVDVPPGEPDPDRGSDTFFSRVAPSRPVPFGLALAAAALQYLHWAMPATMDLRTRLGKPAVHQVRQAMRRALKISNDESDAMEHTLLGLAPLLADAEPGVAAMKRFLARATAPLSRDLLAALPPLVDAARVQWLQQRLSELEQTEYAPPPLITGDDLTAAGLKPGPLFKRILDAVYDAQLEGRITDREAAMSLATELTKTNA